MSKRRKFMIVCCIVGPMIVNLFTIAAMLNGVVWLNAAFLMAKSDAEAVLYGTTAGILGSIVAILLVMTARRPNAEQARPFMHDIGPKPYPPHDSGKRGVQPSTPLPMQPVPPRPTPLVQ